MKNILILIVAAAVFLHFYPQPEVTKFYEDKKNMLLDSFAEFTKSLIVRFIPDCFNAKGLNGVIGDCIFEGATDKGW